MAAQTLVEFLPPSRPAPPTPSSDGTPATHLRVAPDNRARRRRTRLAVWSATLITVFSLFALVAFHVLSVQAAFELDQLTEQQAAEARRYERLRREVAERSSPAAIVSAAEALGMVFPTEPIGHIEAAPAAPTVVAGAETSDTLTEAHEAKPSLGP